MTSVNFFKENAKNKNTTAATNSWYKNFVRWANGAGKPTNIENMEKTDLNKLLELYFAETVRLDNKQFEPSSLGNMQAGIDRYLREKGCTFSIIKDIEFSGSRNVLEGRGKYLREQLGMGRKPNAADSFSRDEENKLWESGQLGSHSGEALVNTMHMLLTKHLGLRGRQEHHSMRVEEFAFKVDDEGNRYVTFAEGITKTRGGGVRKKFRKVIPKMFETRVPGRCPVEIFETFLQRRPVDMRNSGPMYLAIINNPKSDVWFKVSNIGVNYINNITKTMVKKSPFETTKKLTNHAWRKTTVKQMRKSGASRSEIIEVTGHSNEDGLDPYDSGDEFQQKKMSYAIDGLPPPVEPRFAPGLVKPVGVATGPTSTYTAPPPRPPTHTITSASAPSPRPSAPLAPSAPPPPVMSTPMQPSSSTSLVARSLAIASSVKTPNFRLVSDNLYERFEESRPANVYNFYGCDVQLDSGKNTRAVERSKRKRVMILSDESSQE